MMLKLTNKTLILRQICQQLELLEPAVASTPSEVDGLDRDPR